MDISDYYNYCSVYQTHAETYCRMSCGRCQKQEEEEKEAEAEGQAEPENETDGKGTGLHFFFLSRGSHTIK